MRCQLGFILFHFFLSVFGFDFLVTLTKKIVTRDNFFYPVRAGVGLEVGRVDLLGNLPYSTEVYYERGMNIHVGLH